MYFYIFRVWAQKYHQVVLYYATILFFATNLATEKSLDLTTMAVAIKRLDSEFVFITVP